MLGLNAKFNSRQLISQWVKLYKMAMKRVDKKRVSCCYGYEEFVADKKFLVTWLLTPILSESSGILSHVSSFLFLYCLSSSFKTLWPLRLYKEKSVIRERNYSALTYACIQRHVSYEWNILFKWISPRYSLVNTH